MTWALAAGLVVLALTQTGARASEAGVRLHAYEGPLAYGLEVLPPWEEGGKLVINLPEHLERWPDTAGILRHNDREPKGHWEVSADGMGATLDVASPTMEGVWVKGTARVVGADRVELVMRIENRSEVALPAIRPLYCFHYRYLSGFPQYTDNFRHAYVVIDGKPVALADIPTENPEAAVKAAYVRGCEQRDTDDFPREYGGLIEDRELDAAMMAVTALEGRRKLLVAWTPGKSILSNAQIPCIHGDPYYEPISPGKSGEARGVVVFTEEPVAEAMSRLLAEGAGAPAGTGK